MADAQELALDDRSVVDDSLDQRETSSDRNLPPTTLGQDLRKARQCKGITPEVIWRNLKIAPHHLTAIENGCFGALPGRVYAVGFVRSYARYLGLDVETCLARLKTELPGPDVNPLSVFRGLSQPEPAARFGATPAETVDASDPDISLFSPRERLEISPERSMQHYVVIGLIIAVLIYGGYNVFSSSRLTARSPVVPVPARLATEAGLTPNKPKAPKFVTTGEASRVAPASVASAEIASTEPVSVRSLLRTEPTPVSPPETNLAASTEHATNSVPAGARAGVERLPALSPDPNRTRLTGHVPGVRAQTTIATLPDLSPKPNRSQPAQTAAAKNVIPAPPNSNVSPAPVSPPQADGIASAEAIAPQEPLPAASEHGPRFRPPLPLGARYGLENGNSRVVLRLHRSIRVSVKGSRNRVFLDRLLGAGATYRVPNTPGVKLTVRDAGAVEVILDGNTVGFAGKDGVAARALGLDPPSIIRRYHWQ